MQETRSHCILRKSGAASKEPTQERGRDARMYYVSNGQEFTFKDKKLLNCVKHDVLFPVS